MIQQNQIRRSRLLLIGLAILAFVAISVVPLASAPFYSVELTNQPGWFYLHLLLAGLCVATVFGKYPLGLVWVGISSLVMGWHLYYRDHLLPEANWEGTDSIFGLSSLEPSWGWTYWLISDLFLISVGLLTRRSDRRSARD